MRRFLLTNLTALSWLAAVSAGNQLCGQSSPLTQQGGDVAFAGDPVLIPLPQVEEIGVETPPVRFAANETPEPADTSSAEPFPLPDGPDLEVDAKDQSSPHTAGAPMLGDGGMFFTFPEDPPTFREKAINFVPHLLTYPNKPLGDLASHVLGVERDELHTDLDEEPLGIQYIPPRPPLLIEWNEEFLGAGELSAGIELGPLGPVWRPAFWLWGEFRTGFQYYDNGVTDPVAEFANRLDLFSQLNLTGTERILFAVRPLDFENKRGTGREFLSYDFRDGQFIDGVNFQPITAFFEGDFGELFPMLDPYDSKFLDYGFSIGRMPLLAQQGLLINEDMIDAVTVTRNTANNGRNLNRRMTMVYSWDEINRNSAIAPNAGSMLDHNSRMVALLTETDYARSTVNADFTYVTGDDVEGDLISVGLSSIRRHYFHHNSYNTSLHVLASFPTNESTAYAQQGELIFAQTSWTPHHYHDLIYLNGFLAIDQFTSPARGPATASPLGLTGVAFAPVGLGRFGPPMGVRTNDMAGSAIGYQWFFCDTRKQLIWEVGGAKETTGPTNNGSITTLLRYQAAHGQHKIFVADTFVGKQEARKVAVGGRLELRVKF